jgi:hypothetical protein
MPSINLGRIGIVNKGDYVGGTTIYKVNDICKYNNSVYICIQAHSQEHLPTDTHYWKAWIDLTSLQNALDSKANKEDLLMAIGNINNPLLDMPLKNSLAMKSGVGSVTFTRASIATYIDRYGVLKLAGVDTPRFEKQGYLNEGGSTNLLLQSNDMIVSPWVNGIGGFVTQSSDNSTIPFLSDASIGLNVTKFVATSTPSRLFSRQTQTLASSTTYTASVFMYVPTKYGSAFSFMVDFSDTYSGTSNTYPTGVWVRAISTVTITTGSTSNFDFNISIDGVQPIAGDTWYCVAPQLEALSFATTYIPTVNSTVTRAADILNFTKSDNIPNIEANGIISVVCDLNAMGDTGNNQWVWAIYNANNDHIGLVCSDAYITSHIASTTDDETIHISMQSSPRITRRIAQVVSNAGNYVYKDGVQVAFKADTDGRITATCNSSFSTVRIGSYTPTVTFTPNSFHGHISNFRVYDRALTAYEVSLA